MSNSANKNQKTKDPETPEVKFNTLSYLVAALNIIPLPPRLFTRAAKRADAEFFFEEAIRFFNYGARPRKEGAPGEALVEKGFARVTPEAFEQVLNQFCRSHTEYLYEHITNVYRQLSPKTVKEFSAQLGSHDWIKAAAADERLKAIIVPHAMFGKLQGTANGDILQFVKVVNAYRQSAEMLEQFHAGINEILKMLSPKQAELVLSNPWAALDTKSWVGSAYSLVEDGDANGSFLSNFTGNEKLGLAEKIYATIALCVSTTVFKSSAFKMDEEGMPLLATTRSRQIEAQLRAELAKLTGRFGVKKRPPSQLEIWMDGLRELEDWLRRFFEQASTMPIAVGADNVPSVIRSDLTWGFILCAYLRLHFVRAIALALTASVPFRQIYDGGLLWPGESERVVPGIVGIISVSLWEYFTNTCTTHPLSSSARTLAPSKSPWDAKNRCVDPIEPLKPPSVLTEISNPLVFANDSDGQKIAYFPPGIIAFSSGHASEDTKRIYKMVQLKPEQITKDTPSPIQRYSGLNMRRWDRKGEPWEKWRQELPVKLAEFRNFPPAGDFPIPIEHNPPILDNFFVLLGEKEDRVFNKWGSDSDSGLSYAIKIPCQLQMYVAGWLYANLLSKANLQMPEFSNLSKEIKFTAGSLQYGGKFPPHITHRDGYGADWSLYGKPDQLWHWSVHWPRDDKTKEQIVDGKKQEVFFATLVNETEPLRRKCQLVRQAFSKLLTEHKAKSPEHTQARKKIHEELSGFIPKEILERNKDTDGYYKLDAIPSDPLIAQHRDKHNNDKHNNRTGLGDPAYVFRDHLKGFLFTDQNDCQKFLRDTATPHSFDALSQGIKKYAINYLDWPIFPDRTSHWAHHLAHLAVLLSMPLEFCWGAPIYHFRAIRAACVGFLDAPQHPFLLNPKEDTKFWPLPIPRLQFLPHDHHHHWHLNYWRSDVEMPDGLRPPGLKTHLDFVSACLPMWVMLGVDFRPFELYLVEYATKAKGRLLDDITELIILLHDDQRRITDALPTEFRNSRGNFLGHLAELSLEDFEDPNYLSEWPIPGSRLAKAIGDATKIKKGVDLISNKLTKDMLPVEIREALERTPDEQTTQIDASDSSIQADQGQDKNELQTGASLSSKSLNEQYKPQDSTGEVVPSY